MPSRTPRYLAYQYKIHEVLLPDPTILEDCLPPHNMTESSTEEVQLLREAMLKRLLVLAKRLSIKRYRIVQLTLQNKTQAEIAVLLNMKQPAVSKLRSSALAILKAFVAKDPKMERLQNALRRVQQDEEAR